MSGATAEWSLSSFPTAIHPACLKASLANPPGRPRRLWASTIITAWAWSESELSKCWSRSASPVCRALHRRRRLGSDGRRQALMGYALMPAPYSRSQTGFANRDLFNHRGPISLPQPAAHPGKRLEQPLSTAIYKSHFDTGIFKMLALIPWIGGLAALLTSLSYAPQVRKALPAGSTNDLSLKTLVCLTIGLALWVLYGFLKSDLVIVSANLIGGGLSLSVLLCKLRDLRTQH
jgi:MtN3 and saliva related transmembrane protein